MTARANRSPRRRASASPRSADLPGRPVRLSPQIPAGFDAPLAAHHKAIGRWVNRTAYSSTLITRAEARQHIEQTFQREVLAVVGSQTLADLRVAVLEGHDQPPAIAIICDSVGQIDLGWIEKTNVLAHTLYGSVAPVGWRTAAYGMLHKLAAVLPVFGFEEMMEELSGYYWDGEVTDEGARHVLVTFHGQDPDDVVLPSQIMARRPDYMIAESAAPMKALPPVLRAKLKRITSAWNAVQGYQQPGHAWQFDLYEAHNYLPGIEDASPLPAMTLVPADDFAEELDQIGQPGIELGFHSIAGLCPLTDSDTLDQWFTSLRLGAELLAAAADLIDFDPAKVRP